MLRLGKINEINCDETLKEKINVISFKVVIHLLKEQQQIMCFLNIDRITFKEAFCFFF